MILDIHIHTNISPCSVLPIPELLDNAKQLGIDCVCITDHDTMAAADFVQEGVQDDGLIVLMGMEYTTRQGQFLIYGPFERIRPGLTGSQLLDLVEQSGGAAVAAHPFRRIYPVDQTLFNRCHALETMNGGNRYEENMRACEASGRLGIPGIGASDAHHLNALGRMVSETDAVVRSRDDLIAAIREGRLVSHSPCP